MTNLTVSQRFRMAVDVFRGRTPIRQYKRSPIIFPDWRMGQPQWHTTDLASYIAEGFTVNSLIYSAIMYEAKALSSIPLRAYRGDPDNPEPLPEGDQLAQLVSRPNPAQSWREFMMPQEMWLNLAGNAFTVFDPDGSGVYFLWSGPQLIYVGQSNQIGDRLFQHSQRKRFGRATWIAAAGRREVESRYVLHYSPPLNRTRMG